MRELFSLKTIALAAAFVVAFALAGFGAARLLPAPSYATAAISTAGGIPAEGELERIARDVDGRLADLGLPARVTATRTQISILVPPSTKDVAEVQALLRQALENLPVLGVPATETPYAPDRIEANLEKIRRAEDVIAQQAQRASDAGPDTPAFDFNSYAQAVLALATESDRLSAIAAAFDPSLQTIKWTEPKITMQMQRVSGLALTFAGAAFGLLLFLIVALVGTRNRATTLA
jgi:hypothetical protein